MAKSWAPGSIHVNSGIHSITLPKFACQYHWLSDPWYTNKSYWLTVRLMHFFQDSVWNPRCTRSWSSGVVTCLGVSDRPQIISNFDSEKMTTSFIITSRKHSRQVLLRFQIDFSVLHYSLAAANPALLTEHDTRNFIDCHSMTKCQSTGKTKERPPPVCLWPLIGPCNTCNIRSNKLIYDET